MLDFVELIISKTNYSSDFIEAILNAVNVKKQYDEIFSENQITSSFEEKKNKTLFDDKNVSNAVQPGSSKIKARSYSEEKTSFQQCMEWYIRK